VAMAYAMLTVYGKRNRMISAGAALLRGYNAVNPLTDLERRHLVLLVSCRLACSATLGAYSIQQNPENTYLLLHSKPAWDCLELIWGRDATKRQEMAKVLNQVFDLACSVHKDGDADVLECTDLAFPDPVVVDPLSSSRASDSANGNDRPAKRIKSEGETNDESVLLRYL
jgi:hypothetical protein